jgi:hypothetical protein
MKSSTPVSLRTLLIAALMAACWIARPDDVLAQRAHGSGEHPNHGAILVGAELIDAEHSEVGFVIGADYMRHVAEHLAVGGAVDLVLSDSENVLKVLAGFSTRVTGRLTAFAAPGIEFVLDRKHEAEHEESDTYYVQRVGLAYGFDPIGEWALAPIFSVDVTSSGQTALMFGISAGRGW